MVGVGLSPRGSHVVRCAGDPFTGAEAAIATTSSTAFAATILAILSALPAGAAA